MNSLKPKASHWKIRVVLDSYHTEFDSIEAETRDEYVSPRIGENIITSIFERISQLEEQFPNMVEIRIIESAEPGLQNKLIWRKS